MGNMSLSETGIVPGGSSASDNAEQTNQTDIDEIFEITESDDPDEAAVTVLHGLRHAPGGAFELRRVRARGADTVGQIVTRMAPPTWR